MFAVSALIPSGSGLTLVTKVLGQVKADAPVLLAVLGGVVAIAFVIHLLLGFVNHIEDDKRRRDFIEGKGEFAGMNTDAVDSFAELEASNRRTIARADEALAENDRIMSGL